MNKKNWIWVTLLGILTVVVVGMGYFFNKQNTDSLAKQKTEVQSVVSVESTSAKKEEKSLAEGYNEKDQKGTLLSYLAYRKEKNNANNVLFIGDVKEDSKVVEDFKAQLVTNKIQDVKLTVRDYSGHNSVQIYQDYDLRQVAGEGEEPNVIVYFLPAQANFEVGLSAVEVANQVINSIHEILTTHPNATVLAVNSPVNNNATNQTNALGTANKDFQASLEKTLKEKKIQVLPIEKYFTAATAKIVPFDEGSNALNQDGQKAFIESVLNTFEKESVSFQKVTVAQQERVSSIATSEESSEAQQSTVQNEATSSSTWQPSNNNGNTGNGGSTWTPPASSSSQPPVTQPSTPVQPSTPEEPVVPEEPVSSETPVDPAPIPEPPVESAPQPIL